jgi:hypothetical protein
MSKRFVPVLTMLAGLVVCGSSAAEVQSVEYYENNDKDRNAMLTRCKQLAANANKDANCVNARRAAFVIANRSPAGKPGGGVPTVNYKNIPVAK